MGRDDLTYGIFRGRMTEDGLVVMPSKAADEELRARLFAVVSREELVACMDNMGLRE